jgi:very-short-patch-repair endonuclease
MSWPAVARRQSGAVTRDQLRAAGLSDDRIDHFIATGSLERQTNGVYLVRGAPLTHLARVWVGVLATAGIVGFDTAAYLWGVLDERPPRVHLVIPHARRVHIPAGVRLYRVPVPERELSSLDGLRITSRSWTVLDVVGRMRPQSAFQLADRALQQRWITPDDIWTRLREFPGRTGNRMLRVVATQLADGAAAQSERLLHQLLKRSGITGWIPNLPVYAGAQLVGVLDIAFPAAKVAIEIDGWAFHSDVDRFQRDRHRQNALHALGWTVLRFTWADLTTRPDYVVATIRAQLARAS